MDYAPLARIGLRYLSGALMSWGIVDAPGADFLSTDPDIIALASIVIGAVVGAATEAFYVHAKRKGGAT